MAQGATSQSITGIENGKEVGRHSSQNQNLPSSSVHDDPTVENLKIDADKPLCAKAFSSAISAAKHQVTKAVPYSSQVTKRQECAFIV
jgi:hypothetical protein